MNAGRPSGREEARELAMETSDGRARTRVESLVHLLGDDSDAIRKAAWDELLRAGGAIVDDVRGAVSKSEDLAAKREGERFVLEQERLGVLRAWCRFCETPELDLETGALLFSKIEDPRGDVRAVRKVFEDSAAALARKIGLLRTTESAVKELARHVHEVLGIRGDREGYYSPENSYLHTVVSRQKGIPISIATVYLAIARRLRIPLHGVGMPQHFLLKFRSRTAGREREIFVDCFNGGAFWSARDCAKFLSDRGVTFQPAYLRRASDEEMLRRSLGNLLRVYHEAGDDTRASRVSTLLHVLDSVERPRPEE